MNSKYFIIISLLLIANQILSQIVKSDLKNIESFCCYGWLPEFQDSVFIIVDETKVNQKEKYCVLTKATRKNYQIHCWVGSQGLENPTKWVEKLKIRYKKDFFILKFGKRKVKYKITKLSIEEYVLVKKI